MTFRVNLKILLFLHLLTILTITQSGAQTVVTILGDTPGTDPDRTLRQAYENADPGDTITFDPSLDGQTIILDSQISITKDITIDASDLSSLTISGNNTQRIISVSNNSVVRLAGLRLVDGSTNLGGGALFVHHGTTVLVENCLFENNETVASDQRLGGAIHVRGDATIRDSIFVDNFAEREGGAIGVVTLVSVPWAKLHVERCTFHNNSAQNYGGAIAGYSQSNGDIDITILHSTFTGNSSVNNDGGAMDFDRLSGSGSLSVRILHCTITENTAGNRGGAISLWTNVPHVTFGNSIIANNSAPTSPNIYAPSGPQFSIGGNLISNITGMANLAAQSSDLIGTSGDPLDVALGPREEVNGHQVYFPTSGSPAIDLNNLDALLTGDYQNPAIDQLGNPRVVPFSGCAPMVDSGAVERPGTEPTTTGITIVDLTGDTAPGYTNDNEVRIQLTMDPASSAACTVQISTDPAMGTFTEHIPESTGSFVYTLQPGLGTRTLYARVANTFGTNPTILSDTTEIVGAPSITSVSSAAPTYVVEPFAVEVVFSEAPSSFSSGDISVDNGTVGGITGSGTQYTVTIIPTTPGPVAMTIPSGAVTAESGLGFASGELVSRIYRPDTEGPLVAAYVTNSHVNGPFPVYVHFNEEVTGFTTSDVSVTSGSVTNLAGSGASYEVTVDPTSEGQVEVTILSGAAIDIVGNASTNSSTVVVQGDFSTPTTMLTGEETQAGGPILVEYDVDAGGSGLASLDILVREPGESDFVLATTITGPSKTGIYSHPGNGSGPYEFAAQATDMAGNTEALPTEAGFSLLYNATENGAFTHLVSNDGSYVFPMTNEIGRAHV